MKVVFASIWREAMTPNDYRGKPYDAVLNQIGHIAVGAFFCAFACVSWGAVAGEMPVRALVWLMLVTAYYGVVEIGIQGLRKADSMKDTFFVALGVAIPLVALAEVSSPPVMLLLNLWPAFGIMVFAVACLIRHAISVGRLSPDDP